MTIKKIWVFIGTVGFITALMIGCGSSTSNINDNVGGEKPEWVVKEHIFAPSAPIPTLLDPPFYSNIL